MSNPFDWQYLTSRPSPAELFGPFSIAYLVVVVAGLALSAYVYARHRNIFGAHQRLQNLARRSGSIGLSFFGIGLILFGLRAVGHPQFGIRIWMNLFGLATVLLAIFALYYYYRVYPKLVTGQRLRGTSAKIGSRSTAAKQSSPGQFKWKTVSKRKGKKKR